MRRFCYDTEGSVSFVTQSAGPDVGPIGQVREGMTVVDAENAELGSVELVKMGDPEAVTPEAEGQRPAVTGAESIPGGADIPPGVPGVGAAGSMPAGAGGLGLGLPAGSAVVAGGVDGSEPDVGPELAERLLRSGYIKINSKGWFHRDVYADAGQIDRVIDETVCLSTTKADLAAER
jgi:hypothetical protein